MPALIDLTRGARSNGGRTLAVYMFHRRTYANRYRSVIVKLTKELSRLMGAKFSSVSLAPDSRILQLTSHLQLTCHPFKSILSFLTINDRGLTTWLLLRQLICSCLICMRHQAPVSAQANAHPCTTSAFPHDGKPLACNPLPQSHTGPFPEAPGRQRLSDLIDHESWASGRPTPAIKASIMHASKALSLCSNWPYK